MRDSPISVWDPVEDRPLEAVDVGSTPTSTSGGPPPSLRGGAEVGGRRRDRGVNRPGRRGPTSEIRAETGIGVAPRPPERTRGRWYFEGLPGDRRARRSQLSLSPDPAPRSSCPPSSWPRLIGPAKFSVSSVSVSASPEVWPDRARTARSPGRGPGAHSGAGLGFFLGRRLPKDFLKILPRLVRLSPLPIDGSPGLSRR